VGADIKCFSMSADAFHAACLTRHRHFPNAMLATATHDHKRGEDVRARLAVLSEIPDEWGQAVRRWRELNALHRRPTNGPMPSPGDEAMLYQMIVGAWPTELDTADAEGLRDYTDRLAEWQLKAMREAKLATDWTASNSEYEDAARSFLYTIMADTGGFITEAANVAHRIGPAGAVNGLAQTLLKLTVPGVPDVYQGQELWDFSLVDPDNRRPVDFAMRQRLAEAVCGATPADLARGWQDGREKLLVAARLLGLRRDQPELFASGDYQPLEIGEGRNADRLCAFSRSHAGVALVVAVPRLVYGLFRDGEPADWGTTELALPSTGPWRNVFTGAVFDGRDRIGAAELFADFPVAVLFAKAPAMGAS
jgi:(1->4)-alpha-D-glucan 1-alpha-D-glucosylmutase